MKIIGNLTITNENYEKYKGITEVSGYVDIRAENASLPALTEVSGSVDIRAENASLPALTKSGSVDIRAENASLPALTKSGSVYIRAENASLPALTEVSGSVDIRAENASLPALKSFGSYKKSDPLPLACPKTGEFEAWKKCEGGIIVKLLIPADARRSSADGKKCRAEFADVLEIIGAKTAISKHDGETLYEVGKRMKCHKWDSCRWHECSGGIHLFMTREEAETY